MRVLLLLSHTDERGSVIIRTAHDVSPRAEHALNLARILTVTHLIASLRMVHRALACQVVTSRGLLDGSLVIDSTISDTLASSTKESLHTTDVVAVLRSLLLRLILVTIVNFLMSSLVLHLIAVIATESGLGLTLAVRLDGLHLALERIVDTLPLSWVTHILRTVDGLHCHIWTQWHALMNVARRR